MDQKRGIVPFTSVAYPSGSKKH